jgi:DNA-binding MarR family transcriptional regulator
LDGAQPRRKKPIARREALFQDFHVEATAFLHEIVATADALRAARDFGGEPAMHFGTRWRLLRAIERCGGAPTFTDLGRLLDMSRQGAREHVLEAARTGLVELFQAPEDRRAWQVVLTPVGRHALEQQRMPPFAWVFTLLNGLEPAAMRNTAHVLRVVRLRLERYEKDRRRVSGASARR